MRNMKLWMFNAAIGALQNELDRLCKAATANFEQTPEALKAAEGYVKELLENEQCEIGRVNATLNFMISSRDDMSLSAKQEMCTHPAEKVGEKKNSDCAHCTECDKTLGWFCPESPDKQCHYYTSKDDKGYYVELRSGERHYFNNYKKSDQDDETDDSCLFCGEPDERK